VAVNKILTNLQDFESLTFQLIVLAAPSGSGKTSILQEISKTKKYPLINVDLELASKLKDLSDLQRSLHTGQILTEIIDQYDTLPVLLDNIELLFDVSLKLNPLSLLKKISRNRPLISSWNGTVEDNRLNYAAQGHPQYSHYDLDDIIVINLESTE
jgi:ABC-type lipoprotein export system ATPase subunit